MLLEGCGDGSEIEHLDDIQGFIEHLEALWSRFIPTSELTRVNEFGTASVAVSRPTFDLVRIAVDGWRATGGLFDPSVGSAMIRCGYDRTFDEMTGATPSAVSVLLPTTGCAGIELDESTLTITVPEDTQLDLGGIGKGHAADLVGLRLRRRGVPTACINVGGDIRCIGGSAFDGGWIVEVEDPFDPSASLGMLSLSDGAIATSARTRRHWTTTAGNMHHLLDPSTGQPARAGLAQVTVLAAEAAQAEILAKAAFLSGVASGRELIEATGTAALFVTDTGEVVSAGAIDEFRR